MRTVAVAVMLIIGLWGGLPSALAAAVPDGAHLFEVHCVGCHLQGGNIIRRGKTLKQKALEQNGYDQVAAIAQIVTQGKGNMSAYQERMTAEEIQAVSTYVLEQAAQNWKT